MRILFVGPFAFLLALSAVSCVSSDSTSAPPAPDASTADANVPKADSGAAADATTPPPDSGAPDANEAAVSTCPIAADATVAAKIEMSVDDNFKLYVNGVLAKEFTGTWNNVQTVDVTLNRNPTKKNVIAVEGINAAKTSGLDRMIVAELVYTLDTTDHKVVTDATWTRGTTLTAGWEAVDFAETGWAPATVEGAHGDAPYGAILGTSDAKYLWSYDSSQVDVAAKVDAETVYFRKTFYVSQAGAPQATAGTCN